MANVMVRASDKSRDRVRLLALQTGHSMQYIVDWAIERLQHELFWQQANSAYEALTENPVSKREQEAEQAVWDETLMDGLDKDEEWEIKSARTL